MKSWVKKVVKVLAAFFAVIMFVGAFMALSNDGVVSLADAGDTPGHTKGLIDNGDGTYTLSLSVTGEAEVDVQTASNVNVLIVYDVSQSMTTNVSNNRNRANYAEDVVHDFIVALQGYQNSSDPSNIEVALVTFGPNANIRQTWTSDLSSGSSGVNRFFDDGNNDSNNENDPTGVFNYSNNLGTNWEHALIQAQSLLTTLDNNNDTDPTFVIFVTDGVCTKSGTGGGNGDSPTDTNWTNYRGYYNAAADNAFAIENRADTTIFGIYAYGNEHDLLDDLLYFANTPNTAGTAGTHRTMTVGSTTYNIMNVPTNQYNNFDFGDTVEDTTNYFKASDTAALTAAIEDVFQQIVQALGVGSVSITDGTTHNVQVGTQTVDLLEIVPNSFNYYLDFTLMSDEGGNYFINNDNYKVYVTTSESTATFTWTDSENASQSATYTIEEAGVGHVKVKWTEATALYPAPPAATNNNGTIDWDLKSLGTLLNGVTYTVTFDVYPSQTTLDYVADIRNDPGVTGAWSTLPSQVQQYIDVNGNLSTNTTASLSWQDTRPGGGSGTTNYVNPDPVENHAVEQLAVAKEWENVLDSQEQPPVTLSVLRDGTAAYTVTLQDDPESDDHDWEDSVFISVGIMGSDGQPLEGAEGHDFTFSEPSDISYHWELDIPVVHPMIINGVRTMLVKVDDAHPAPEGAQTYTFVNYEGVETTYYVDDSETAASLTATNYRRSRLTFTKVVENEDAPDVNFPFTFNVVNALAPESEPTDDPNHESDYWVWFSVRDKDGNRINEGVTGATASGNNDGYWYAPSGTDVTIQAGAGCSIWIINLPTGSTYSITEGALPDGFTFTKAELNIVGEGTDSTFSGARTTTGTIESTNSTYQVTYTNDYELTSVTVDKVWEDSNDLDGIRPESLTLTLYAGDTEVTGVTPVITKSEDGNTWTYTWSGLPMNDSSGEAIDYRVSENDVPPDYECSYPEGVDYAINNGRITNTHEVELTSVTVTKEWDDDDETARPDSVTVQLLNGKGEAVGEAALNADNDWTYTWENLPASAGEYSVSEAAVDGYMSTIAMEETDEGYSFTITNHNHGFTIEKVWEDENDHDEIRPDSVTVTVTGTVTESGKPQSEDGIEVVEVTPVDGVDTDDEEPTLRGAAPAETDAEDEDDAAAAAAGNDAAPANGGDDTTATADGNDAAPANGNDDTAATADGNDAAPANDDDIAVTADGNDAVTANDDPAAPVDETGDAQTAGDDEAQQADPTFRLKRDENETGEEVTFSIDVVLSEDNDWTVTLTDADVAEYVDFNEYSWDDITFTVEEVTVDGYETSYDYDEDGLGVTITNTHEVPEPVNVTLSATKILNGRDLQAGEFSFQLLDANDAVVETVANAADGAVNFSAISFDAAGTYTYSIVEVAGSLGGVTYDTTKINVTVTVTNNEGTLTAAVAYSTGDAAQFTNTYEPADATATITARKVLTGRALQAGEFSFQLINDEGTVYQTVTNAADGSISFAPITYSSEGTYTYTIAEVAGSAEGVTYDSHRFTVTVTVEDNGQGALVATVSYPTQPVFSNIYVPPTTPAVPTGDSTNAIVYVAIALAAAAVCLGSLIARKRAR